MESSFGKKLASPDQTTRERATRALMRWLSARSASLTLSEYLRLWKGLFYCVWLADKPKYQNELSDSLADLVLLLPIQTSSSDDGNADEKDESAEHVARVPSSSPESLAEHAGSPLMLFIQAFWETMGREWSGIDHFRLDKFYYLMQQIIQRVFVVISKNEWNVELIQAYGKALLLKGPLDMDNATFPDGLRVFFIENYPEILKKTAIQTALKEEDAMKAFSAELTAALMEPLLQAWKSCKRPVVSEKFDGVLTEVIFLDENDVDYTNEDDEALEGEDYDEDDEDEDGDEVEEEDEDGDEEEPTKPHGKNAKRQNESTPQGENTDSDGDNVVVNQRFDYSLLSKRLFELGSNSETPAKTRRMMYSLSKNIADSAAEQSD